MLNTLAYLYAQQNFINEIVSTSEKKIQFSRY